MHILSELRNPMFDAPDRQRALRALQMSRLLRENNHTKAWTVVKSMIDKVLGEQTINTRNSSSGSYVSPTLATSNSSVGLGFPAFVDQIPSYATQRPVSRPQSQPQSWSEQPVQTSLPPAVSQAPTQPAFNWDEINFNNIIDDLGPKTGNPELPEFDFVSLPDR